MRSPALAHHSPPPQLRRRSARCSGVLVEIAVVPFGQAPPPPTANPRRLPGGPRFVKPCERVRRAISRPCGRPSSRRDHCARRHAAGHPDPAGSGASLQRAGQGGRRAGTGTQSRNLSPPGRGGTGRSWASRGSCGREGRRRGRHSKRRSRGRAAKAAAPPDTCRWGRKSERVGTAGFEPATP